MKIFFTLFLFLAILPAASANESSETAVYHVERSYELTNDGSASAEEVELIFYAFDNYEKGANQHILSENIAPKFPRDISSNQDNRVVQVDVGSIDLSKTKTVKTSYKIRVDDVDIDLDPDKSQREIPDRLKEHTEPVANLWQSDDSQIQNKARELTENLSNYYLKVKSILNFVDNHLSYEVQSVDHDALWAINHLKGDCTEYSNLFIALCRAENIPARAVSGYLPFAELDEQDVSTLENVGHQWAIVYFPSRGWVPADLTYFINGNPQLGYLSNDHLVELLSSGESWVKDSQMQLPSPHYRSKKESLSFQISGTVNKVIAINTEILSIRNDPENLKTLEISVKVSNEGEQEIDNLEIRLEIDNTLFGLPSPEKFEELAPGTHEILRFDLEKKQDAESETLEAIASYETTNYGEFTSSDKASISVEIVESESPSSDSLKSFKDFLHDYFYLILILGILVSVGVAVIRR